MPRALPEFTKEARSIPSGSIWEHYSKKRYLIIGVARHSETHEELVVYQALYGDKDVWVRPLKMFLESVEIEDIPTERFTCVSRD